MVFKVKNIFITGGNRGIGLRLTKEMLKDFQPNHLFVTYRKAEKSKELLELATRHSNLHLIQFDVTDYDKLPAVVKKVESILDGAGINLLINNAAFASRDRGSICDINKEDIMFHLEPNTIAPILMTQAFLPLLEVAAASSAEEPKAIRRAAIVNMSSTLGSVAANMHPIGGLFSYRMTKTALNMGMKCVSADLEKSGITTILVHPGWVKTDMGTEKATLTVNESIEFMMKTFRGITAADNGKFLNYDGTELPW